MRLLPHCAGMLHVLLAVVASNPAAAQAKPSILIYSPALADRDEGSLGLNVATLINTEVWRTLRMQDDQGNGDFGSGSTAVGAPLAGPLAAVADLKKSQIIIWGSAFRLAGGAVAETHLNVFSVTEQDAQLQTWSVAIDQSLTVTLDVLPERSIDFLPTSLRGPVLKAYSDPGLLKLYQTPKFQGEVKLPPLDQVVSYTWKAKEQTNAYAHVLATYHFSDGTEKETEGYLQLPPKSEAISAPAIFAAAVARVLRTDWQGALDEFAALRTFKLPVSTEIDAELMSAYCAVRLGRSSSDYIEKALALNPTAIRSLRYKIMVQLADAVRAARQNPASVSSISEAISSTLAKLEPKLSQDDPWVRKVHEALTALEKAK